MTSQIRIRPAADADGDAIARVFVVSRATLTFLPKLLTDDEEAEYARGTVLRDHDVLVGERGGSVVGFAAVAGRWVEHLYVHPVVSGVGSAPPCSSG